MIELPEEDLVAVWAGQLELRLRPETEEYSRGFRGAYTTVLVRCTDAAEFVTAAKTHLAREGFSIMGIERLFSLATGAIELNGTIAELARLTRQYPVQWTTFHLFKDDA